MSERLVAAKDLQRSASHAALEMQGTQPGYVSWLFQVAVSIHWGSCLSFELLSRLIMESRTILKVDIGFHTGLILWALLKSLYRIHVRLAYKKY